MNDKYHIELTKAAQDDMDEVFDYIAFKLDERCTAERQCDRIWDEIYSLNFMPYRYALVDQEPWRSRGLRKLPVNNYIIFYTVNEDTKTVEVTRVLYAKRDLPAIFRP